MIDLLTLYLAVGAILYVFALTFNPPRAGPLEALAGAFVFVPFWPAIVFYHLSHWSDRW